MLVFFFSHRKSHRTELNARLRCSPGSILPSFLATLALASLSAARPASTILVPVLTEVLVPTARVSLPLEVRTFPNHQRVARPRASGASPAFALLRALQSDLVSCFVGPACGGLDPPAGYRWSGAGGGGGRGALQLARPEPCFAPVSATL